MNAVTSNAVSKALGYSTSEYFTGKYWVDGKKIYGRVFASEGGNYSTNYVTVCSQNWCQIIERIIGGVMILPTIGMCVNKEIKRLILFVRDWLTSQILSWASQFCNRKAGWQNE